MQTHIFVHLQQHEITGLLCLLLLLCGVLLGAQNSRSLKYYFESAWVSWLAGYFILSIILNTKLSLVCECNRFPAHVQSRLRLSFHSREEETPWFTAPMGFTFLFFCHFDVCLPLLCQAHISLLLLAIFQLVFACCSLRPEFEIFLFYCLFCCAACQRQLFSLFWSQLGMFISQIWHPPSVQL